MRGLTRQLWRGRRDFLPEEGSTFFRSERKYQRKHAARRLREKALYCPFLTEGVRNVARNIVGELTHAIVRARAHSYPLSKRARLFPSAAYRRSRPRGQRGAYLSLVAWDVAVWLEYICNTKCQRGFKSTLAFLSSHKACRRMAVYISQLTGNRTRPASREACCRAAVIQRPSRMSHWHPARPWRAVRG